MHKIPIGTLVEVTLPDEMREDCAWHGIRLFVVAHYFDCDKTPLYALHWDVSIHHPSLTPVEHPPTMNGLTDEQLLLV